MLQPMVLGSLGLKIVNLQSDRALNKLLRPLSGKLRCCTSLTCKLSARASLCQKMVLVLHLVLGHLVHNLLDLHLAEMPVQAHADAIGSIMVLQEATTQCLQ